MKRFTTLLFLVLALSLVAVACSSGDDAALVADGKLTVCSESPYEPFEFEDPSGPAGYSGFDIELMDAIAKEMSLELVVANTPFDGIWLQPAAGACDVVASAMTITEERAQNALFSDPYFNAAQSLMVTAGNDGMKLADTDGKNIGVQVGTTGEKYAEENKPAGAVLVAFDEGAALFLALESGSVDAILQDLPVNGYRATQDANFVITETYDTEEQYGFGMALENEALATQINDALKALKESGTYGDLHEKYFGTRA
ncbi:MAG: transporter substrate-binding domain-containing protein [Actinomycetota bacterium]|nr:transporter substrate-binding domain-containing protein [Actinomycetota bacterium]